MADATASVEVEGAAQLTRTLRDGADDLKDLTKTNTDVARYVAARAAAAAPRRTGALASSVRPVPDRTTATVSSSLVYAGPIHWGWPARNIAPQPFLINAATQTEPTWVGMYDRELERIASHVKGA